MDKKLRLAWSIGLMFAGIWSLVLAMSNIIGFPLPDILIRICGIIDVFAVAVIIYTSVKIMKK